MEQSDSRRRCGGNHKLALVSPLKRITAQIRKNAEYCYKKGKRGGGHSYRRRSEGRKGTPKYHSTKKRRGMKRGLNCSGWNKGPSAEKEREES